jgi:hypothetical protein
MGGGGTMPWERHDGFLGRTKGVLSKDFGDHMIERVDRYLKKYGYIGISISDADDDGWDNVNHVFTLWVDVDKKVWLIDSYIDHRNLSIREFDMEKFTIFLSNKFDINVWNDLFNVRCKCNDIEIISIEFYI